MAELGKRLGGSGQIGVDPITGYFIGEAAGAGVERQVSPDMPDLPAIKAPTTMPTVDSEEVRRARRRALAAMKTRRGRQSTILSDTILGDTLG